MGSERLRDSRVTGSRLVTGAAPVSQISGTATIDLELTTHNTTFVTAKSPVDRTLTAVDAHAAEPGSFPRYFKVSP